ncbi:uncharacterized protein LODBEIA_P25200 [Lodderomyces beijingensis]|uniref:NAD-dependent epimerase/dehydratase domain-containing protein n=1 Tax=Lodderomyces beijingensis TaxID=1775926 RepID=A0ABP0ZN12_9ASCO
MPKTVFLSGATGYIAQHVLKQLLEKGYRVIGSVRSEAKGENLKQLTKQSPNFSYVVIPNIADPGAFDKPLQDHPEISVFLHTASPVDFDLEAKDFEAKVLKPAIDGTKSVLSAIKSYGKNIEHLVVTSSVISVINITGTGPPTREYNEESWNPITWEESFKDSYAAYGGAKTFAEREVWNFVDAEQPSFTVTTIQPTYVCGPQAFEVKNKLALNFSAEIVNKLLRLKAGDEIPEFYGDYIDVRDTAKAHIFAFENSERANGHRLILQDCLFSNELLVDLINKNFPSLNLPKADLAKGEKYVEEKALRLDVSKTRKILDFDFIPLEQSIIDSVQQVLDTPDA